VDIWKGMILYYYWVEGERMLMGCAPTLAVGFRWFLTVKPTELASRNHPLNQTDSCMATEPHGYRWQSVYWRSVARSSITWHTNQSNFMHIFHTTHSSSTIISFKYQHYFQIESFSTRDREKFTNLKRNS